MQNQKLGDRSFYDLWLRPKNKLLHNDSCGGWNKDYWFLSLSLKLLSTFNCHVLITTRPGNSPELMPLDTSLFKVKYITPVTYHTVTFKY